MTDRELRHMSRSELLQMLIMQIKENRVLSERLAAAEAELNSRQIAINNAGSLAEAALSLNHVFDAAESAAQQYIENIKRISDQQDLICQNIQKKTEEKAAQIIYEAQEYNKRAHAEADSYWRRIVAKAEILSKTDVTH